jgi:hypothetical protein
MSNVAGVPLTDWAALTKKPNGWYVMPCRRKELLLQTDPHAVPVGLPVEQQQSCTLRHVHLLKQHPDHTWPWLPSKAMY